MELRGKRVLITGASSGIGAATAEAFAREGAEVALVARSREGLEVVAGRARAAGALAHVVPCDVGERPQVEAAVEEALAAMGGLDVLVSNAATETFGNFRETPPEDFERTIAVTFLGAVNLIRAALPHLERDGGGRIVITGSVVARLPMPTFSSYTAAKSALRGFANTLRIELADTPITVSMVHPGVVDTPLWNQASSATGREPKHPPGAYAAEEVAAAIVSCARTPRRELTVGLEGRLMEMAYAAAPALGDRVIGLAGRWFRRGDRPADPPGGLWEPQGRGETSGGLLGRPSLWRRLRAR